MHELEDIYSYSLQLTCKCKHRVYWHKDRKTPDQRQPFHPMYNRCWYQVGNTFIICNIHKDKQTQRQTDKHTHRQVDRQAWGHPPGGRHHYQTVQETDKKTNRQTDKDKQTGRQKDKQTGRHSLADKQTDRQTDRQCQTPSQPMPFHPLNTQCCRILEESISNIYQFWSFPRRTII